MNRAERRAIQNTKNAALAVYNRQPIDTKPTDTLLVQGTGSDRQSHVFHVRAATSQADVIEYMEEANISSLSDIKVDVVTDNV